jgi:FkbH-like protein/FkbM family methyltransferase
MISENTFNIKNLAPTITFFHEPENSKIAEYVTGLSTHPYLADHTFQNITVLPGSIYIDLALLVSYKLHQKFPSSIKNVKFISPVILTKKDTNIEISIENELQNFCTLSFYESPTISAKENIHKNIIVSLELNYEVSDKEIINSDKFEKSDFIDMTDRLEGRVFYSKLDENGNQYGPAFRNIKNIWIKNNEALCSFDFSSLDNIENNFTINPLKLDSFTQLLSVLDDSKGRTFVLNKINEIKIFNQNLPDDILCKAKISERDQDGNGFTGDLEVYDEHTGQIVIQINGVKFTYLENAENENLKYSDKSRKICISSTFTAEPVEKSLQFWSKYFNDNYKIEFAPYNQVFQELLNPSSLLAKNNNGINIILLNLEDWSNQNHKLSLKLNNKELDTLFKDKLRYSLPNNIEIVHLNEYETDYVYKEIFEDKCYMRHGIQIKDGDTIIDIGANIGLFTLFVNQFGKNIKVYSFEPSPVVYDLLKLNSKAYGSNVKTFNYGVSDQKKNATFTFYRNSSVFSSFNANENEDKEAIQAVVRNMLREVTDGESAEEFLEEITNGRLESELYVCELLSVSDIISENKIAKINLLKIDAEKSELAILNGINENDWNKIEQIVIEVHDKSGELLKKVESILIKKGFRIALEEEKLLEKSGLYNIYAVRNENDNNKIPFESEIIASENSLRENCHNFQNVLKSFMNSTSVPMIVGISPPSSNVVNNSELHKVYTEIEQGLTDELKNFRNVFTISSSNFLHSFNVENYFDEHSNALGHIPFTPVFYSSMGTTLSRLAFAIASKAYKVIILDCDNTLWKGVCGEDGVAGIKLSEPFKYLQSFMVEQVKAGKLICLCSKNNEEDVWAVFDSRKDMILKKEHLISWKLNWNMKSENIRTLSEELNLGLDSFIFVDDNPVECAEVKANLPEVLTLHLPQNEVEILSFLKNSWAFDYLMVTEEDKKRTKMYKENIQRENFLSSSLSLKDFLDGLNLQIKISEPLTAQMERVSQLTFRTNQFNFTTRRRSETDISNLLTQKNFNCLVTEVSDRFGDYGLVGVVLYNIEEDALKVDTFLLSCRVLGRGVEYKILSELGNKAEEKNLDSVIIEYIPSSKNRPVLEFIEKIGSGFKLDHRDKLMFKFPVSFLRELKYNPSAISNSISGESRNKKVIKEKITNNMSDKIQLIASRYSNIQEIHKEIEAEVMEYRETTTEFFAPSTNLEKQLTNIWQKVLGISKVGLKDNFFEIGGSSLKAVQLIAKIRKELGFNFSLVKLFECPTVQSLALHLNNEDSEAEDDSSKQIVDRGKKRRIVKRLRKRNN